MHNHSYFECTINSVAVAVVLVEIELDLFVGVAAAAVEGNLGEVVAACVDYYEWGGLNLLLLPLMLAERAE